MYHTKCSRLIVRRKSKPALTLLANYSQALLKKREDIHIRKEEPFIQNKLKLLKKEETRKTNLIAIVKNLSKGRLAGLVILSTMCGYALAPLEMSIKSLGLLTWTSIGTFLCVSSANTYNQALEIKYDGMMSRTRNRILVREIISKNTALKYALATNFIGPLILFFKVNPLVCALGLSNIILYAFIYTPLKRKHYVNTWVGSVVGAIPPIMGYAAATNTINLQAVLLGMILFAWQFPHFNSLCFMSRKEYLYAGYKMLANVNPQLNATVAMRYSIFCFPICIGIYLTDMTTVYSMPSTSLVNLYMFYYSYKFYKKQNSVNARKLFLASLIHLPLVFICLMVHKNNEKAE